MEGGNVELLLLLRLLANKIYLISRCLRFPISQHGGMCDVEYGDDNGEGFSSHKLFVSVYVIISCTCEVADDGDAKLIENENGKET